MAVESEQSRASALEAQLDEQRHTFDAQIKSAERKVQLALLSFLLQKRWLQSNYVHVQIETKANTSNRFQDLDLQITLLVHEKAFSFFLTGTICFVQNILQGVLQAADCE